MFTALIDTMQQQEEPFELDQGPVRDPDCPTDGWRRRDGAGDGAEREQTQS